MAISDAESALITKLTGYLDTQRLVCESLEAYYNGTQRLEMLGLAVPPQLARFTTVVD